MPTKLLAQAMLVYSDPVSRWMAMRWFMTSGPLRTPYGSEERTEALLADLRHGSRAAAEFSSDLATLIRLARATPPFTVASASSRAAANVSVLVNAIDLRNGGCLSTGGYRMTALPVITWRADSTGGEITYPREGGSNTFDAHLSNGAWQPHINAC